MKKAFCVVFALIICACLFGCYDNYYERMERLVSDGGTWRSSDGSAELTFYPEYSKGVLTFTGSGEKFTVVTRVNAGFALYRYDPEKLGVNITEIPGINPTRSLVGGVFGFDGDDALSMTFYYHAEDYDDPFFENISKIEFRRAK